MKKHPDAEAEEHLEGGMTRRNFITTAGMVAVGGALASGAMAAIASTGAKETTPGAPSPPLPWPWAKLDPMEAGKRAYQNYHAKGG